MSAQPVRRLEPLVLALLLPLAAHAQRARPFPDRPLPATPESPPLHPPAAPCASGCGADDGSPHGVADVLLHSGELHLREVDLAIPGRGLDFVWTRTYRSRTGTDTPQGHGWVHSYDIRASAAGPDVRVMDGGGRNDVYRRRDDGTFVARELFRVGRFVADGSFELTFADTGTWTLHPLDGTPRAGRIAAITDRNGNAITFEYDALGRLSLVVDTLARGIQVLYRPDGRIGSLVDFTGRSVLYDYHSAGALDGGPGDLRSVRSPLVLGTPNGNDFPAGKTTTYAYSRGFADERLNHNLLRVTDPRGRTWMVNEYGDDVPPEDVAFDRLVRQTRGDPGDVIDVHYEVGAAIPPDPVVPPDPIVPAWPIVPMVLAIVNDRVGNVSDWLFDERGRCIRLRQFTGRADPDQPTTPSANRPGAPLRPDDPPFFETRWEHNEDSLVTRVVHPNGNETVNVHELELDPMAPWTARGNLRARRRLPGSHDPVGDQPSLVETFEYDPGFGGCCGTGFVTRHVDARGNATEHDYDAAGNRIQTRHRIPTIVEDFTYDAFGRLTSHTLPDNGSGWRRRDEWTYFGPGTPQHGYLETSTVDALGAAYVTTYVRDARGNALQIVDPRGQVHALVVNALDQVVRRTSPPVELLDESFVQYRVDTRYDANDNVVASAVTNVDDEGVLQPNAELTTTYEYDTLNRIVRRVDEEDSASHVVEEYELDANRNVTLVRRGEAVNGNQTTNVVRTYFDERDKLLLRIDGEGSPEARASRFDPDPNGNPRRVTSGAGSPDEHVTTTIFDAYDRAVYRIDPMGNETLSEYDPNGNLVRARVLGELCDVAGSAGNVTLSDATYAYDAMDRRVQAVQQHFDPATELPIGDGASIATWTWTDLSDRASETDDRGNATTFLYDTAGRLRRTTDARGNRVELAYDGNDNVVAIAERELSDVTGTATTYVTTREHDELDRLVSETDPAGNVTRLGYDSRGNLTRVVDGLGNESRRTFDGVGRLTGAERVLTDTGTGGGGVIGTLTRGWEWDDSSRLVSQTDPKGHVTSYEYDALDRRTKTIHADGTVETCAYDAHGLLALRLDANGTLVTSTYDANDRLAARTILPGAGIAMDTMFETWKHDGFGRLVHAEDDDSLVTRAWDTLGLLLAESQDGRAFVREHDGAGNEVRLTYPGGKVVERTFDVLNRVDAITNMGPVADFDYVGPMRVERRVTGAGLVTTSRAFDAARRLTSLVHQGSAAVPLDRRTYGWDGAWNRTLARDELTGVESAYSYDSQYRLVGTRVEDGGGMLVRDTIYAFDPAGNRTSVTGDPCAGAYTMDASAPEPADEQMNQYTSAPCAGALAYDACGSEVARAGHAFVRDWRGRVVAHTELAGGVTTTYTYDALGRRRTRTDAGGTREYLYDGVHVVEERVGGSVDAVYVRGPSGEIVERGTHPMAEKHDLHFFFADALGSTRVVTDASGVVVERYDYSDYGEPVFLSADGGVRAASAIGNAWLFAGLLHDGESDTYLAGARYLDPRTGRFTSRDPLGVWGDPTNVGVGATYAGNNPQTLADPTGLFSARADCQDGPWPGQMHVYYERVDCGLDTRIPSSLCAAKNGAGRGYADYRRWSSLLLEGPPGNPFAQAFAQRARLRFRRWFGGPDGRIDALQMGRIGHVLRSVWDPFEKGLEIPLECEGDCDGANAYTAGYDCSLHLCPAWFSTGITNLRRGAILLHEMTHEYAGLPQDTFYYGSAGAPDGPIRLSGGVPLPANPFESDGLVNNADTYEELLFENHVSER